MDRYSADLLLNQGFIRWGGGRGHSIQLQTEFAIKSKFSIGSDTSQISLDSEPPDDEGNDVVVNCPFR